MSRTAYRTTPELVAKQVRDFYSSYPHGDALSGVRRFALSRIRPNRGDYDQERVDEYVGAIARGEPMPPIVVKRYPNETKYTIRDGTHRDLASRAGGLTHIPVLVEEAPVWHRGRYRRRRG